MDFKLSNCVAVQTNSPGEAKSFYESVMGMNFKFEHQGSKFAKCGDLVLFIDEQDMTGPILDFEVNDAERAKELLVFNGCKILKWDQKYKFVRDPFGLVFNLTEVDYD